MTKAVVFNSPRAKRNSEICLPVEVSIWRVGPGLKERIVKDVSGDMSKDLVVD